MFPKVGTTLGIRAYGNIGYVAEMRFMFVVSFLALNSIACSSSTSSDGPCAQRSGAYSIKSKTRDGDCGELPEQIQTLDKQPTEPEPPCTGTISYSDQNCTVTLSATCPGPNGTTIKSSGIARWSEDGSSGTATIGMNILDPVGRGICTGSYDWTYTKL